MRSLSFKHSMLTRSLTVLTAMSVIGLAPVAQAAEWYQKPIVKQAAIGAAAGVAAGALSDRVGMKKGVLTGVLVGAGSGYMDQNDTLASKPLLKRVLQGTVIGGGTGYAADYGVVKGGVIGAVGGAGYHYARNWWDNR